MIFLIGLIALTLFSGYWLWRSQLRHSQHVATSLFAVFPSTSSPPVNVLERLGQWRWFTTPGFIINKTIALEPLAVALKEARDPISVRSFLGIKQLIITFSSLYVCLFLWFGELNWMTVARLIFLIGLTYMLPNLWLKMRQDRVSRQLAREVPYFLDLLVLTLKSGLNIEPALRCTAENKKGILARVIEVKLKELTLGKSLEDVFDDLKKELPNQEFKQFINSLLRAQKLGVSLAETLDIQSRLIRTKRRQRAETLSRTAAVKISLPLVLFIFPALLIVYIGPGLLQLIQA
jgi:tight adherence protein C